MNDSIIHAIETLKGIRLLQKVASFYFCIIETSRPARLEWEEA